MIYKLKRFLSDADSSEVLVECRQCGATLDGEGDPCPECGSSESARYQL